MPPKDFKLMHCPLSDYGRTDLNVFFKKVFPFIDKAQVEGKGILIFCSQGVNRAPTTTVGYLMHSKRWSLKEAYEYVRKKRPQASPHEKYFDRLLKYETSLFGVNSYTEADRPESLQEFMRKCIGKMRLKGEIDDINPSGEQARAAGNNCPDTVITSPQYPVLCPINKKNSSMSSSGIDEKESNYNSKIENKMKRPGTSVMNPVTLGGSDKSRSKISSPSPTSNHYRNSSGGAGAGFFPESRTQTNDLM
mmetsp:Transcript_2358/g.3532  ORF Transcript_2358/g.3532 Transcript_2358/m.3532 type:complete len:249 (+) Transcript_2358:276-1022(+)